MTGLECKRILDNMTEDELLNVEVPSYWTVAEVENMMDAMGYDPDVLSIDEKREILHRMNDECPMDDSDNLEYMQELIREYVD